MLIELIVARLSDLIELRQMVTQYTAELAEFYPAGVSPPMQNLDAWLASRAGVFEIIADDKLAGFVIMAMRPSIPGVCGNYLAEFYVAPDFRHGTAAIKAGSLLMHQYPGEWTADVLARNTNGLRFAEAMTQRMGKCVRHRMIETPWGPAMRFRWMSE
jgi:predicted acetyltransferase